MAQTWKINGQVYTHGQLMELKRQGFNPLKDKIIMKVITPNLVLEKKETENIETNLNTVQPSVEPELSSGLPTNFMQLKKLAKEKGMEVTKDTKKDDIVKFLNQ